MHLASQLSDGSDVGRFGALGPCHLEWLRDAYLQLDPDGVGLVVSS